jgi:hypothetical protein
MIEKFTGKLRPTVIVDGEKMNALGARLTVTVAVWYPGADAVIVTVPEFVSP